MLITEQPAQEVADELTMRVVHLLLQRRQKNTEDISPDLDLLDALKNPQSMTRAIFVELSEAESTLERELESLSGELADQHDATLAKVITLMDKSKFMLNGKGQCKEKPRGFRS